MPDCRRVQWISACSFLRRHRRIKEEYKDRYPGRTCLRMPVCFWAGEKSGRKVSRKGKISAGLSFGITKKIPA